MTRAHAVGVFVAFTCSQAGMMRWQIRHARKEWPLRAGLNAVGAAVTLVVAIILFVTKFHDGAWIVGVLLALLLLVFRTVHAHYGDNAKRLEIGRDWSAPLKKSRRLVILVPRMHRGLLDTLQYARSLNLPRLRCA